MRRAFAVAVSEVAVLVLAQGGGAARWTFRRTSSHGAGTQIEGHGPAPSRLGAGGAQGAPTRRVLGQPRAQQEESPSPRPTPRRGLPSPFPTPPGGGLNVFQLVGRIVSADDDSLTLRLQASTRSVRDCGFERGEEVDVAISESTRFSPPRSPTPSP